MHTAKRSSKDWPSDAQQQRLTAAAPAMVETPHFYREAEQRLGRPPVSADDIVVMVSDVLYDYLPQGGGTGRDEAILRLREIIESPLALEIYEQEMQRRNPRDVDRWH